MYLFSIFEVFSYWSVIESIQKEHTSAFWQKDSCFRRHNNITISHLCHIKHASIAGILPQHALLSQILVKDDNASVTTARPQLTLDDAQSLRSSRQVDVKLLRPLLGSDVSEATARLLEGWRPLLQTCNAPYDLFQFQQYTHPVVIFINSLRVYAIGWSSKALQHVPGLSAAQLLSRNQRKCLHLAWSQ